MAQDPTLAEQEALATTRRAKASGLSARERIAAQALTAGFVLACVALWLGDAPHGVDVVSAALVTAVLVLALRVRFETPFGFGSAAQLAFVPLMFGLPPALVPIATCLAVMCSALPDVIGGRLAAPRLLNALPNSWFALGPALVFELAGRSHHYSVFVLLAALVAQFAADLIPYTLRLAMARGVRARDLLSGAPAFLVDLALAGPAYVIALQMRHSAVTVLFAVPLLGLLGLFARERTSRLDGVLELADTYRGTALLLGDVVAADDSYTGLHTQGVVELAMVVGEKLGLAPERRRNLEFGARLHDVGKIAIPKAIINKPGRLDPDEWAIVRTHSAEGQRMLSRVGGFMRDVGTIVRAHHERWDGTGYPDGLLAEEVPLEARIITCCDSWNAMRTDRPYRPALSHGAALEEIIAGSGTQFDPRVARALLDVVGEPSPRDGPTGRTEQRPAGEAPGQQDAPAQRCISGSTNTSSM